MGQNTTVLFEEGAAFLRSHLKEISLYISCQTWFRLPATIFSDCYSLLCVLA